MNRYRSFICCLMCLSSVAMLNFTSTAPAQSKTQPKAPPATDIQNPQPYPMPWKIDGKDVLGDVSFLLEKPAGKDGFITVKGEHFVKPDGSRFKIWGVNITFAGMTPPKADAPAIAAHLARFGVNAVRTHHIDNANGILNKKGKTSGEFDPDALDRFDFFISELKKQGVYIDLNLNVSRRYREGDGVRDYKLIGYGKGSTYFNPRLIELQKEYARALLTHKNPYTGNEYRHEPAVCTVELVNENSLLEAWKNGRLVGSDDSKESGTWRPIPLSYDKELTDQYNAWLAKRLSPADLAAVRQEAGVAADAPVPRLNPKQFAKAGKLRFHNEYEFYLETEKRFFSAMITLIKKDLGVKVAVIGNSIHSKRNPFQYLLPTTTQFDALDTHVYWNHPETRTSAQGKTEDYFINTPMVNSPEESTVVALARSRMPGKPFTVSEVNHPFPTDYLADGFPVLAAYAAFHDWDGIYWFCFDSKSSESWEDRVPNNFDIRQDPIKMSQLAGGALLFLRGDVRPSVQPYQRTLSRAECIDSLAVDWKYAPLYTPGFPARIYLQHATDITALDRKDPNPYPSNPALPIKSDTGELTWDVKDQRGVITIAAPRAQGLIGFVKGSGAAAPNLKAAVDADYCALTLTALDEKPIAGSARLLLTAGARLQLTGSQWNAERHAMTAWGKLPMQIEPVGGTVTLTGLQGAKVVEAVALDGAGRSLGQPLAATAAGADWILKLGSPATTWYLITVKR